MFRIIIIRYIKYKIVDFDGGRKKDFKLKVIISVL